MQSRVWTLTLALVLGCAVGASAQAGPTVHDWSDGTSVNLFGGLSAASGDASGLIGGGAGWDVTPRLGLEGRVGWADLPGDAESFAASLTLNANLRRPRPLVPFIKAGVGLYRASFGASAAAPRFYRRRMPDGPAARRSHAFVDPTLVAGAGLSMYVSRHVSLRPELGATLVLDGSRTHTIATITMHLAYHFEARQVTPARTR